MSTNASPKIPGQIVAGLIVIGLGFFFLLGNLGVLDPAWVRQLWPLVFVIWGIAKIHRANARSYPGRGYFGGGILILLGLLMTLDRLGVINFSWHAWWPVLLIALGILIMLKRDCRPRHLPWTEISSSSSESDDIIDASAVLGGYRRQVHSQHFRGGEISAIMGGCEIDLRGASIDGEAILNVISVWGGIELKVPTDWTVILQGSGILGGFVEKTVTPPNASKRLIIRGYAVMGGFEVKN